MKILLATPPMTQLNTPYPATAYLTGFLRSRGVDAVQADPAIELVCRLFSSEGLRRVRLTFQKNFKKNRAPAAVTFFLKNFEQYESVSDSVLKFLQGKDPSLALRITGRNYLPEGSRFQAAQDPELNEWAFGVLGVQDQAKFLASLFVDDLADVIREGIDSEFQLSRYGEKLASSQPTFDPLSQALSSKPTLVDEILAEITTELLKKHKPDVVALTAPFPGNVYGAFRMAKTIRKLNSKTKIILGGGFVNTELRDLTDSRVFDYFDFLTLDDGERPLLSLIEYFQGKRKYGSFLRTFVCEKGKVKLLSDPTLHDIPHKDVGTPTYDGLPLDRYLSILEMLNPMHRIWSDGRWNKLTLAHGCYWKKCNFCDVTLDYIGRYDAAKADLLVDRMVSIMKETGQSGFHFVDEAAPPAVLRALALRLIERKIQVTWWGNIRFEKTFTPELCQLLARSGCVAVSGGLEVASDRLLELMNKGVSVEQVARVTHAFTDAGVMVHAYLMYGFPTQTTQETIDSLERVRQLFEVGCIQSAYWHRFSATAHSPIGKDPKKFKIKLLKEPKVSFARNDLAFTDAVKTDHEMLGRGLRKSLYNYMLGHGFDLDLDEWFEKKVPAPKVPKDLVQKAISN